MYTVYISFWSTLLICLSAPTMEEEHQWLLGLALQGCSMDAANDCNIK